MEVHKHPHHVTHKKKWGEYLLEFLMLFLAVYLGFLAENFREHQVEKKRGREYIESFYEDLKTDTARISSYINFDGEKLNAFGDLGSCFDTMSKTMDATPCMQNIIQATIINRPFGMTERTLSQLAAAGGFRLLQTEDADSIIAYQKEFDDFKDFQLTIFQSTQDNVRNTLNLLGNFQANVQMFKPMGRRLIIVPFEMQNVTGPILFTNDKTLLNKYFNELVLYYRVTYNHRGNLLNLKDHQARLVEYFKRKYHFE